MRHNKGTIAGSIVRHFVIAEFVRRCCRRRRRCRCRRNCCTPAIGPSDKPRWRLYCSEVIGERQGRCPPRRVGVFARPNIRPSYGHRADKVHDRREKEERDEQEAEGRKKGERTFRRSSHRKHLPRTERTSPKFLASLRAWLQEEQYAKSETKTER